MANPLSNPYYLNYLITPLVGVGISFALAILVFRKDSTSLFNRLFSLVLFSLGLWSLFTFFMRASPDVERALYWDRLVFPAAIATSVFYYHFTAAYTHESRKKLLWVAYSLLVLACILSPAGFLISHMTLGPYGYAPHFHPALYGVSLGGYLFLVMGLVNLTKAFRSATRYEERTRLNYMIIAIILLFSFQSIDFFPNHPPMGIFGNILFGLLTAIAILKYHLFDIRIAVRRGLAYLLTSAAVASLYVGFITLINLIVGATSVPIWAYVGLLILLALVFLPLWQRVQRLVDRWFYRQRYDFLRELECFSQQAHDISDINRLGSSLVKLLNRALQASAIHLLLLSESGDFTSVASAGKDTAQLTLRKRHPILRWSQSNRGVLYYQDLDIIPRLLSLTAKQRNELEAVGVEMFVPLKTKRNELVGLLLLGKKLSQQPYSPEDEQLVVTVASRVTIEVENARLYSDALRARQTLEAWLNTMDDCVIIVGMDHTVQFVNKAATQRLGNTTGCKCWNILGKEECAECPAGKHLLRHEHASRYAVSVKDREYDVIAAPLLNADGSLSIIEVLRDITERKQMEAERRDIEQKAQVASRLASVGEMAAGIAHEINNPLTGVIGFSQLLMREDIPDSIRKYVDHIYCQAQRVADVVNRLLNFSRPHKPQQNSININEVVQATLSLRAYEMETSNIALTTKFDPGLPHTMADAGQLQQVFLNIIINAETEMRLAHGRGKLLVKTERIDRAIRISFKDDGPGIAEENLDRIFDPFFTTREPGQGTGLGLSLCHWIVSQHNGQIYAKSKLGMGATFIVELPIVVPEKQKELAEPAHRFTMAATAKILVVDDEPAILEFLSKVLADEEHKVDTVDNARDALLRLKCKEYDLILVDIKLPSRSGIELYQQIQEAAQSLAKKVVFTTGDVMGADTSHFLSQTGAPYITKPFDAEKLKDELDRILAQIK